MPRPSIPIAQIATALLATVLGMIVWRDGATRTPAPAVGGEAVAPDDAGLIPLDGHLPGDRLRVGFLNMRKAKGRHSIGGRVGDELTAVAAIANQAHLVGLAEVGAGPPAGVDQAAEVADRIAAARVFAPTERRWWGEESGNALVSRLPIASWQGVPLPGEAKAKRNLLIARVPWRGETVVVYVAHAGQHAEGRHQAAMAADLFARTTGPAVLMGDLNRPRDDPAVADLLAAPGVVDALPPDPERIDYLLVRGLRVLDAGEEKGRFSDHPFVWADLALPAGGAGS